LGLPSHHYLIAIYILEKQMSIEKKKGERVVSIWQMNMPQGSYGFAVKDGKVYKTAERVFWAKDMTMTDLVDWCEKCGFTITLIVEAINERH
jgi:hypothetical protein